MKIGDRFISFNALQNAMQQYWDVKFSFKKSFIHHLPQHHDVSCAKHVFYNENFLSKEITHGMNSRKLARRKPRLIGMTTGGLFHPTRQSFMKFEILRNLFFPEKDHPSRVIKNEPVKRLIIGQFKEFSGYVFLGLYKLDQVTSFSYDNTTACEVDGASFPCNPTMGFSKPLISYPHCVWKRIADGVGKQFKE